MKKLYDWAVSIGFVKKLMHIRLFEKLLSYEVVLYVFFGVVTTVVNYVTFLGCDAVFGTGPITTLNLFGRAWDISWVFISNLIAWVVGVLVAFVTNKLFVFESKSWRAGVVLKEFPPFVGARLFSLLVETFGLVLLFNIMGINAKISKALLAVFVVIINYFFSKFVIFTKKKPNAAGGAQDPLEN
ncbi:MAG: GtrA family protein [Oscillospiraceae bacterium]|jgi:putative flippase GtrA|nr:GtrA family protein [Oscillospiraceae bacterium]